MCKKFFLLILCLFIGFFGFSFSYLYQFGGDFNSIIGKNGNYNFYYYDVHWSNPNYVFSIKDLYGNELVKEEDFYNYDEDYLGHYFLDYHNGIVNGSLTLGDTKQLFGAGKTNDGNIKFFNHDDDNHQYQQLFLNADYESLYNSGDFFLNSSYDAGYIHQVVNNYMSGSTFYSESFLPSSDKTLESQPNWVFTQSNASGYNVLAYPGTHSIYQQISTGDVDLLYNYIDSSGNREGYSDFFVMQKKKNSITGDNQSIVFYDTSEENKLEFKIYDGYSYKLSDYNSFDVISSGVVLESVFLYNYPSGGGYTFFDSYDESSNVLYFDDFQMSVELGNIDNNWNLPGYEDEDGNDISWYIENLTGFCSEALEKEILNIDFKSELQENNLYQSGFINDYGIYATGDFFSGTFDSYNLNDSLVYGKIIDNESNINSFGSGGYEIDNLVFDKKNGNIDKLIFSKNGQKYYNYSFDYGFIKFSGDYFDYNSECLGDEYDLFFTGFGNGYLIEDDNIFTGDNVSVYYGIDYIDYGDGNDPRYLEIINYIIEKKYIIDGKQAILFLYGSEENYKNNNYLQIKTNDDIKQSFNDLKNYSNIEDSICPVDIDDDLGFLNFEIGYKGFSFSPLFSFSCLFSVLSYDYSQDYNLNFPDYSQNSSRYNQSVGKEKLESIKDNDVVFKFGDFIVFVLFFMYSFFILKFMFLNEK